MLKTLYQIGKEISADREPWEDIIARPKLSEKEQEGKGLYTLAIDFNLDTLSVEISTAGLVEYSDYLGSLKKLRSIKIQGGNNKAVYVCVDAKKPEQLAKTFFGKPDKDGVYPPTGEFIEAIDKDFSNLQATELYHALKAVSKLAVSFYSLITGENGKVGIQPIQESLGLGKFDRIVLMYATITDSSNHWERKPFGEMEGYVAFVEQKFFSKKKIEDAKSTSQKLCYATGTTAQDTKEAEFSGRYNINKFFVKTTRNYASNFDHKAFGKNYQLSAEAELFLDRGSNYLLEHAITDIADIRHVIIPEFFQQESLNADEIRFFGQRADLLFKGQHWDKLVTYLEENKEINGLYWLNFIAIDSDGNYFKIANSIKDVSKLHFQQIFQAVQELNKEFAPWLNRRFGFNLYSFYKSVPVRKDKENVNVAFLLLAALLEQRTVDREQVFRHFSDLVLCHHFQRYRSFTNIFPQKDRDFALRDAVVQYQAFIQLLERLNQITSPIKTIPMSELHSMDTEEQTFLHNLNYNENQRALFYLGRALNRIVWKQSGKGHKKNMLDKLNYNGMDKRAIHELATSIMEAGRHYNMNQEVEWPLDGFYRRFDFNKWEMDSREALFFILSGYTYRIRRKPEENPEEENE